MSKLPVYPIYLNAFQMGIISAQIFKIKDPVIRKNCDTIVKQIGDYYTKWKKSQ